LEIWLDLEFEVEQNLANLIKFGQNQNLAFPKTFDLSTAMVL